MRLAFRFLKSLVELRGGVKILAVASKFHTKGILRFSQIEDLEPQYNFANATSLQMAVDFASKTLRSCTFRLRLCIIQQSQVSNEGLSKKTSRSLATFDWQQSTVISLTTPLSKPSKKVSRFLTKPNWIRLTALTKFDLPRLTARRGSLSTETVFDNTLDAMRSVSALYTKTTKKIIV